MDKLFLHLCIVCFWCSMVSCQSPDSRSTSGGDSRSIASRFENVGKDVDYIGDEACASCHEDLYHGYQDHGMANSMYALAGSTATAVYPSETFYDSTQHFYYRAFTEDGGFYQEEYRLNEGGDKTHRLVREMEFVVGSGSAAHTYLTENGGRYYELPLTWYAQEQQWEFSPGYRESNQRFDREIPDRCMACHNSYPESVPFVSGKYRSVPSGIGCERCHGPGEIHAEERLVSMEAPDSVDYTIVNPAHLPVDRRLDVCQQCHLHGTVSLLRAGREPFDFRPAEPLPAHVSLFSTREEQSAAAGQISVISHADRLKKSDCYIASRDTESPMDCTTCHDPHEGFRSAGPAYFNTTCQDCHTSPELKNRFSRSEARENHRTTANCISCHMPKVQAEDAPHASFTDHWIRVVEDSISTSTAKRGPVSPEAAHDPVELTAYFREDMNGREGKIYEGMAYIVHGTRNGGDAALKRGAAILEDVLGEDGEHGEAYFQLGLAHQKLGNIQKAIPALERSLHIEADIPERLNALAQLYETVGRDTSKIGSLYRRALEIQPAAARIRVNYGRFLETQGKFERARVQYEKVVEEDTWFALGHFNLGTVYLREGRPGEGERELKRAIELAPDYPEALTNLGSYYANHEQEQQARQYLERAVEAAPDHPEALTNLGLFYVLHGQPREAVSILERAVNVDRKNADAVANLGLAHFRLEEYDQARRYAEQAVTLDSSHQLARQIMQATDP